MSRRQHSSFSQFALIVVSLACLALPALAGQAVTSPGILGAVLSGFMACGNILGHERLIKELKACR